MIVSPLETVLNVEIGFHRRGAEYAEKRKPYSSNVLDAKTFTLQPYPLFWITQEPGQHYTRPDIKSIV